MRHLENIIALILLCGGVGCLWVFMNNFLGKNNTCKEPCCNKTPKVTVISEGPPDRSLSQIMNKPPKLRLK